jgi:predicted DNA-binding transcriptional regulator AlpA
MNAKEPPQSGANGEQHHAALAPEHDGEHHNCNRKPQAPPPAVRLLSKREVLAITGVSYPTLWSWMRAGEFPRARICGGKSKWISTEVEDWMKNLPKRRLKGDAPDDAREEAWETKKGGPLGRKTRQPLTTRTGGRKALDRSASNIIPRIGWPD